MIMMNIVSVDLLVVMRSEGSKKGFCALRIRISHGGCFQLGTFWEHTLATWRTHGLEASNLKVHVHIYICIYIYMYTPIHMSI